jgi:hypothetical protein
MKKIILLLCLNFLVLDATPSSVFWTICTTDVYDTGTGHLDEDNYFTVFNKRRHGQFFPPDTGLEFGIFSFKDIKVEAGADYLGGTDDPLFFNIGAALDEDKLFNHSPSIKLGLFDVGTSYRKNHRTNFNIVDLIIGKTLPDPIGGKLCIGAFTGSRALGKNQQGFMVSYQHSFCPAKYCDDKEYFKWVLCGDYASGKNFIGGGGVGIYYYFTPDISILTGPVWFNSATLNGKWKWSTQIDISFAVFTPRSKCPCPK